MRVGILRGLLEMLLFVARQICPSQGRPLEWTMAIWVVLDIARGVGWLRFFAMAWSWLCGHVCPLPCVWPAVGPRLCGFIDLALRWRRCEASWQCYQSHGGVVMGEARMKILHGFCRADGDGICGCHSPPWRHCRACSPHPSRSRCWWMSPGESLDSMF